MTTFKNCVNAFGNSSGDDMNANKTKWGGRGVLPKGKVKNLGATGDISGSSRHYAKAKYGTGGGSGVSHRGSNAFSKGRKGK
jgi:hypothetical protein